MPSSFITSCKNRNEKGFTLYRIPKIPQRRAKCLELISPHKELSETNLNYNIRICEVSVDLLIYLHTIDLFTFYIHHSCRDHN
jgi:hypothetical protein